MLLPRSVDRVPIAQLLTGATSLLVPPRLCLVTSYVGAPGGTRGSRRSHSLLRVAWTAVGSASTRPQLAADVVEVLDGCRVGGDDRASRVGGLAFAPSRRTLRASFESRL